MQDYVSLPFGEHMGFLIGALDGDPSVVTEPALPPLPATVDTELVKAAVEFLRRTSLPIEPRKKWPDGGMPQYGVKGFIATCPSGRNPAKRSASGAMPVGVAWFDRANTTTATFPMTSLLRA